MSHTVIPDHRDGALKLENVANRLVHHCKIVNVKWKMTIHGGERVVAPPFPSLQWPSFVQYFGPEPRKCACLPGMACGNAACPNIPRASCAPIDARTLGNC